MNKRGFSAGVEASKPAEPIVGIITSVIVAIVCVWGSWRIYASGQSASVIGVLGHLALLMVLHSTLTNSRRNLHLMRSGGAMANPGRSESVPEQKA